MLGVGGGWGRGSAGRGLEPQWVIVILSLINGGWLVCDH